MEEKVVIGEIYRYYEGGLYKVRDLSLDSGDPKIQYTVYESLYDSREFPKGTVWSRRLDDFLTLLDHDGRKFKRFELVE